jgi:hypothetical protein
MSYKIIKIVKLKEHHLATGATKHYLGNDLLPVPSELKIVNFEGDTGSYLLYFDKDGNEITDTYHDDINDAIKQAEREFSIQPNEWIDFKEETTQ